MWPEDNIVASHTAGLGSIPNQVSFLVKVSYGFFLNCKTNVRKFRPLSSPDGYHLTPKSYSSVYDGDSL